MPINSAIQYNRRIRRAATRPFDPTLPLNAQRARLHYYTQHTLQRFDRFTDLLTLARLTSQFPVHTILDEERTAAALRRYSTRIPVYFAPFQGDPS